MNKTDFLNMIGDSAPVDRQMMGEMYELIDIFPYFQSAHLLLLKGLYKSSDVKFGNQLRQSSIYAGDRGVLYWLLNSETETVNENQEPPHVTEIESDTQQTVIESARNSVDLIGEIEKESIPDKPENSESEQPFGHSTMVATEPDSIEPGGVVFLSEEETQSEEKIFFMDPGILSANDQPDLLELDLDDVKEILTDNLIIEPEENIITESEPDKDVNKLLQSDLIDRFISANPRIEPRKDKMTGPNDDLSKPFVEESEGLVTETLAKIYIRQGYYSKAIDIYEKLSLKFPEKSTYFASQIEKVKEYIKK